MYISTENYVGSNMCSLISDTTASINLERQFAPYVGQVVRFTEAGQIVLDFGRTVEVGMLAMCGIRCQSIGGVGASISLLLSGSPVYVQPITIPETQFLDIYPHSVETFAPITADGIAIDVSGISVGIANFWIQRIWAGNLIQLDEVNSSNFNVIDPSPVEKSSKGSMFVLQKKLYREVTLGGIRVEDNLYDADTSEINDYEAVFNGFAQVGTVQEVIVSQVGPQEAFHGHMIAAPVGSKSAGLQYIFNANVREF